jgi:EmrB/QacA subfamily drug resistance transporter
VPAQIAVVSSPTRSANVLLALVCTAMFVLQLDFSIVNVALPTIQRELEFTPSELQWVVTGYAMTFGSLLLLGGRAGDLVGRRRLLVVGLVVFGAASLTSGLAQSSLMLVASRVVQGAGGAMVSPAALSLLTVHNPEGPARNRALGYWQAAAAGGASAGVVLGGVLTQFVSWRAIFLVNLPIVAVMLFLIPRVLEADRPVTGVRLDLAGAVVATGALAALIFGLSNGEQSGFASPDTVFALGAFVVLGVAFVIRERRAASPMIPRGILSGRTRRAGDGAMFLMGMVIVSYVYFGSLYLQRVLGFDPLITGVCFVPATGVVVLTSVFLSRRFLARAGVKAALVVGAALIGVGQFWLAHVTAGGSYEVNVLPGLLITSVGMGLALQAASVAATSGVSDRDQGLAGGLFNTSQQVGAAIGLALLATIAAAATASAHGSLSAGYRLAYLVASGIAGLAIVLVATQLNHAECQAEAARERQIPAIRQM